MKDLFLSVMIFFFPPSQMLLINKNMANCHSRS